MTTSRDPFLSVIILWWLKYLAGNSFRWMWKENNWLKWSVSVRRPHGTYFHYFCNHLVNFWPRIKKKTPKSTFSLSMINRQSLSSESFSVATGSLCAIFKVKTLWAVIKVHHLIFYAFWCSLNSNPRVSWWYLMTKKSEFAQVLLTSRQIWNMPACFWLMWITEKIIVLNLSIFCLLRFIQCLTNHSLMYEMEKGQRLDDDDDDDQREREQETSWKKANIS